MFLIKITLITCIRIGVQTFCYWHNIVCISYIQNTSSFEQEVIKTNGVGTVYNVVSE